MESIQSRTVLKLIRKPVNKISNGIRFQIASLAPPTARILPTLWHDRAAISLHDAQFSPATDEKQAIPEDIITAVVNRLRRFRSICSDFGVPTENVHVLATEATRVAINSDVFRARIQDATGLEVRLLSRDEEAWFGALGLTGSSRDINGVVMDLGGGSVQISWVGHRDKTTSATADSEYGISLPYGAAALKGRLEDVRVQGAKAKSELEEEVRNRLRQACLQLNIHGDVQQKEAQGGFDLYLSGGGFRGWGYVLMHTSHPYPIPMINGYRVDKERFGDTQAVLDAVSQRDVEIFGVSKRRASQIPSIAVLVNAVVEALPGVRNVQFCQGGVREGFLLDQLPPEVRNQDPLLAATAIYAIDAPRSTDSISELLASSLPETGFPEIVSPTLLDALANLMYAHSNIPKETRSAAALHNTTTGILASANSITHQDRALLALILCERWPGDLAPADQTVFTRLQHCLSPAEAWWARYLGRVATLIGEVYPSGIVNQQDWRVRLEAGTVPDKKTETGLRLNIVRNERAPGLREIVEEAGTRIEKSGKRKKRVEGYGMRVVVNIS